MSQQSTATRWIDKHETAKQLGITWRPVLELAKLGKIRSERQRVNGQVTVMFDAADVERFAYEREHPEEFRTKVVPARNGGRQQPLAVTLAKMNAPYVFTGAWLTADQAAAYSGLPKHFLLRQQANGRLKALYIGTHTPGGRYRFKKSDLDAIEGV